MATDTGRSPATAGSGHSAEPEPISVVSAADAASVPNAADDDTERMHVVTVQFAIVLDEEDAIEHELADLSRAIGILYGDYGEHGDGPGPHPDPTFYTPYGEWQITDVSPARDYGDLDQPAQTVLDMLRTAPA